VAHQVNALGVMGGGIAKQIKERWPKVFNEYKNICKQVDYPEVLLGRCQLVETNDEVDFVANLFGQVNFGRNQRETNYEGLYLALKTLRDQALELSKEYDSVSIAVPKNLGCGLAGGDWNIVRVMLSSLFENENDIELRIVEWVG
jgi:O-acetyl-ADP-ribose deacetylase (regulator of RNase III)